MARPTPDPRPAPLLLRPFQTFIRLESASGILLLAVCWNLAHMTVMLTDKFAIRFFNVGENFAAAAE